MARRTGARAGPQAGAGRRADPDPDDQHTFDGEARPGADTPEDRDRERQARGRHRAWQDREARDGRPRVQRPSEARAEAYSHRHDSPEARYEQIRAAHLAGLDGQDRAREERAAQERDQLAAERQARISEARARLDSATPKPRPSAPVPDDRDSGPREARRPHRRATDASTTRARRSPATAAPAPTATAMPSPTWGCIAPCRTRTYPSSTTTLTHTSRAARSLAWCAPG